MRKVVDKKTQQRIAKELQNYYSKNLIALQAEYCNKYQSKSRRIVQAICDRAVEGRAAHCLAHEQRPKRGHYCTQFLPTNISLNSMPSEYTILTI